MNAVLRRAVVLAAVLGAVSVTAPVASAFDITDFATPVVTRGTDDQGNETSTAQLSAGAHPDVTIKLGYSSKLDSDGTTVIGDGTPKTTSVAFPAGFGINLASTPHCKYRQLAAGRCPDDTLIGGFAIDVDPTVFIPEYGGIYNLEPEPGVPAQAGFVTEGVVTQLRGSVRSDGDYGITVSAKDITTAIAIKGLSLTLNGVQAQTGQAITSNPTRCSDEPMRFVARATSYEEPDAIKVRESTTEPDGTPLTIADCASVPFEPFVSVTPTTTAPDSPTGADITVGVAQDTSAAGRQPSHLKQLSLLLPDGMTVNPPTADGLTSCTAAQIGLGTLDAAQCPDSSALGEVTLDTPLLPAPLTGKAYLATQGANPFGTTLALYLALRGQGVSIKLAGRVDPDPQTGRLRVTFADLPQLPFSRLSLSLAGGSRAVLSTPAACGTQTVTGEATPWSGAAAKPVSSSFGIDCAAGLGGFAPSFAAGTTPALAGTYAPLSFTFGRPDGQQALTGVSVTLPPGLIARPAAVTPCTDAQASADACAASAKVGSARVLLGSGTAPFPLGGEVFLTGPYKGAPYGLLTRFRAVAGPLDLGTVIVRQALNIDPDTTQVSAVSDPLPTVVGGIPIRLRELALVLDKPGFAVNPTSCAPAQITAALAGAAGASANVAAAFNVTRCPELALQPQLRLSLAGRKANLRQGGHPGIDARLTVPAGQSNLRRVEVKLPLSLALDPDNAETLCEAAAAAAKTPSCPEGSAIGTARVVSPLLPEPLTGPVYFAKGVRTTKTGKQVRTLPTLVLPLRGNGVQINVRANTAVRDGKLVAQFDGIPDAAVSRFDFSLDGGRRGVLTSTRGVCSASRTATVRFRGHSGKLVKASRRLRAACN